MSETDKTPHQGRVLIIAGSDSGGAAGLQADIKSVTALGGFAMTAVTCITAQNTLGVQGVWPIAPDAVKAQIVSVLSDLGADAIKTGLLLNTEIIETVAETLSELADGAPRVIDPVMVASSGDKLLDPRGVGAYQSLLIPAAALVTPNAPEAEILTGKPVETVDGQRRAAEALLERGAKGALVKGGHVPGDVMVDVLQTEYGEWLFEHAFLDTTATHGTGCTLASACATGLAKGEAMHEAVGAATDYLHQAIKTARPLGKGLGPVNHGWPLQDQQS